MLLLPASCTVSIQFSDNKMQVMGLHRNGMTGDNLYVQMTKPMRSESMYRWVAKIGEIVKHYLSTWIMCTT